MEAINHSQAIPDKTIGESVSIATEDYELASKVTGQTINSDTKISVATADNLSLGTSAWVDGSLLIGTGADNKNYYEQNGLITLVFTANCQALNGLNQPIGSSSGKGHIYIQNGKVTIDFPGVSFYRATDVAGWTSFSISSISIEK